VCGLIPLVEALQTPSNISFELYYLLLNFLSLLIPSVFFPKSFARSEKQLPPKHKKAPFP
jgi:hypothetical protein